MFSEVQKFDYDQNEVFQPNNALSAVKKVIAITSY